MKFAILGILILGWPAAGRAEQDPMACVQEIERVCVHLEDKLETCLSDRGDKLSASCRDQLKTAMSVMQDPSGPSTCIPDIQRLCPNLKKPEAVADCIKQNQSSLSEACQKYLQSGQQKADPSN